MSAEVNAVQRWLAAGLLLLLSPLAAQNPGDDVDPLAPLKPAVPAEQKVKPPTLNGLWIHGRPNGDMEQLVVFAGVRFTYRDNQGAAGGTVDDVRSSRTGSLLHIVRFNQANVRRTFRYDLLADTLWLIPARLDNPVELGEVGRMSPRESEEVVAWRRPTADLQPVAALAEVVGWWHRAETPDDPGDPKAGRLELLTDGRFEHTDRAGTVLAGTYAVEKGTLTLRSGAVTRRLKAGFAYRAGGIALVLQRADDDQPLMANDLSDLAPFLEKEAVWRREPAKLDEALLTGHFEAIVDGLSHRLTFALGGKVRYEPPDAAGLELDYKLEGGRMVIWFGPDERRFEAVVLGDASLLLVRADDDLRPREGELASLAPAEIPAARYLRRGAVRAGE
ncbi:MAG: hypothetical protein HYU66_07665 [Armatimonadetes bacterium]|nr:hypothetical protein [Armatimonadota bacterium]